MDKEPLLHDLDIALAGARQRAQVWVAWQQLTDPQNPESVKPYTLEALRLFESAYQDGERNCDLIHHLAVGYHALAWDLELAESPDAAEAWKQALFYWRKLQACAAFWHRLLDKGRALGDEFTPHALDELRQNLMQYLLEVHVDFIRHYYDLGQREKGLRHIEIIRRAEIAPAARKMLEPLAYHALTSTLPIVIAEDLFSDALLLLDDFLLLFPSYLPALQRYLEVAEQWLKQMKPADQWEDICQLERRVAPRWDALQTSDNLAQFPLAQSALNALAATLGGMYWGRSRSLNTTAAVFPNDPLMGDEYQACDGAVTWLKRVNLNLPHESRVVYDLCNSLMRRAGLVAHAANLRSDPDEAYRLFAEAWTHCEESMQLLPQEIVPREVAVSVLDRWADCRYKFFIGAGQNPGVYCEGIWEDLEKALPLQPQSSSLVNKLQMRAKERC